MSNLSIMYENIEKVVKLVQDEGKGLIEAIDIVKKDINMEGKNEDRINSNDTKKL